MTKLSNDDYTMLIGWADRHSGRVMIHRHPKTKQNWNLDWRPHDRRSVMPGSSMYGKERN